MPKKQPISIARLTIRVLAALRTSHGSGASLAVAVEPDLVSCDLVNDVQWWKDNGFSEEERIAMGRDLGCPGYSSNL